MDAIGNSKKGFFADFVIIHFLVGEPIAASFDLQVGV